MKKFFKITFFVILALILFSVTFIVVSAVSAQNEYSSSIGIIGGADGPTAIFVTRTLIFDSPIFWVLGIVAILFIGSAIGWIITRKK